MRANFGRERRVSCLVRVCAFHRISILRMTVTFRIANTRVGRWFALAALVFGLCACAIAHGDRPTAIMGEKSWSMHCHTAGIPQESAEDAEWIRIAAQRCDTRDACVLACRRSGCAEHIGGRCAHSCRGLGPALATRADTFAAMRSCRDPETLQAIPQTITLPNSNESRH
jgi:hypothetical protein